MHLESFLDDEEFRLLTADAFDFLFRLELKRAMRSQNYVTLLSIRPAPHGSGEHPAVARNVAQFVSRQVRETDLLSHQQDDHLSVVLLDADHEGSLKVVERLMSRMEEYEVAAPTALTVGAACCPTDGTDAAYLRRAADEQPVLRMGAAPEAMPTPLRRPE